MNGHIVKTMIQLEIVTPEKKVVETTASSVTVPTARGEIGILPNHAPLISSLRSGVLSYKEGSETQKIVVSGGFVEVSGDKVSILADIAESREEIDVDSARNQLDEAQKVLGAWKGSEEDFEIELDKLEKAQARLALGSGN